MVSTVSTLATARAETPLRAEDGRAGGRPPWSRVRPALEAAARTVLALAILPPLLVLASLGVLGLVLARAPRAWIDRLYTGFARAALRVAGTRVAVEGAGNVRPGEAYVVVVNHESDWDPVVLIAALRQLRLRFVVKSQTARVPIFGPALLLTGNVRVERTHTEGDVERIRAAMAARPPEVSMLFFAEGTRSRDGALHAFKKGAFATAIGHGLPILPVGTAGTRRVWPPLTLRLRGGPVVVEVGAPIAVTGLTLESRDWLRRRTHRRVRRLRGAARERVRALGVEPGGVD